MSALPELRQSNRCRLRQNFGSWGTASRRKRSTALEYHESFHKDVILLPGPSWVTVCKQSSKHFLHENGHILSAFEFRKSWDHPTVLQDIWMGFGSRIPEDFRIRSPSRRGTASSSVAATLPPPVIPAPISHTVGLGSALCSAAAFDSLAACSAPSTSHYGSTGGGSSTCPVSNVTDESSSSDYATYISLVTNVSDLSSDDEELNPAIMASIEPQQAQASHSQEASVTEILLELAEKVTPHVRCRFNINRSAVLDGAFRGFNRTTYNPNATMNVKFSDDLGRSEESVDLGGPRWEFLRLMVEALARSSMFEGSDGSQNLALDIAALRDDRYFCLVGGAQTASPVLKDIADTDIYLRVKKVSQSSTYEDLVTATLPLQDYLANAGCLRPLKTIDDKDQLVNDILMFQIVCRALCKGSNKRISEEVVIPFWRDCLQDAQDESPAKLQEILAFATGATVIPPIGFDPTPSIGFLHENGHQDTSASSLPIANTCINCLNLPLHKSYIVFKEKMDFALGNTHGFGRA
ncbi:hypothetical protein DPEC_G00158330 [Dallia pectoralis]|uniref:Uncharacterized protein n=1 Tax=Dallia pectoralis TaxID=75939 RepID=A0ACC2GLD2_DALPE|nr:hypothetical protein DPEC_G00158330 [Dallia pectoralis]